MLDQYKRQINYLRISVTDLCNLRCFYCMPKGGVKRLPHNEILSFEEITKIVKVACQYGVNKVRLTGGEPLVRRGIISLVKMLADIDEIQDLCMTTNGIYLNKFAKDLKQAGLNRVNISLDTVNHKRYKEITNGGDLSIVFQGIDAAIKSNLLPIKLNCVVEKNSQEKNAREVKEFANKQNMEVRFIRKMDIQQGKFWPVEGGSGGLCQTCNRIRLTSNGNFLPCLLSDLKFNTRELGIKEALELAIHNKPLAGKKSNHGTFYRIGG